MRGAANGFQYRELSIWRKPFYGFSQIQIGARIGPVEVPIEDISNAVAYPGEGKKAFAKKAEESDVVCHRFLEERGIELVPVDGERSGEEAWERRLIIERGRRRRVDISIVISGIQDGKGDKRPGRDP